MGSRLAKRSSEVRKRIESHEFTDEDGDEYGASSFGGFPEYFRRKKIKLQNLDVELRAQSKDNPPIFRGIVAHVNGYTQPSLNDLHKLIVSHGGGFLQYLDGKTMVTHILASNLTPKKAVEFRKYRIVKPAWIVDSVQAGRLLPWDSYRLIDEGVGQKVLDFSDGNLVSQTGFQAKGYRYQSDSSWYSGNLKTEIADKSLTDGKASPPSSVDNVDHLDRNGSTNHRDGDAEASDQAMLGATEGLMHMSPNAVRPAAKDEDAAPVGLKYENFFSADDVKNLRSIPLEVQLAVARRERDAAELAVSRPGPADREAEQNTPTKRKIELTAEEHNAILLSDPRIRKSTVVHPGFLEQYYRESRLHHLSTWKANLKAEMQALATTKSNSQKAREMPRTGAQRYILHVDFDSFFVAVSLKRCPEFKDKPTVVAHGAGPGSEIASCNYPARKYGVKNGMWMKRAQNMCPDLKVLPYDFVEYEKASREFYKAVIETGGLVQSVSVDEALCDISSLCITAGGHDGRGSAEGSQYREQLHAEKIARALREQILSSTGCAVSVGIGGNILLAKLALREAKPEGQFHLKPEDALEFIGRLEVRNLPGVAYSIGGKLEGLGIKYIKDLREVSKERLLSILGPKTGEKLWEYSRGIDRTEVGDVVVRKSVSAEVNWGVRFENQSQVDEFVENLSAELQKRLEKEALKGRQLTLKVMRRSADAPRDPPKHLGHGLCDTFNKSVHLGVATTSHAVITKEALSIMRNFGFTPGELRGIGMQMTQLEPLKQSMHGVNQALGSQKVLNFGSKAAQGQEQPGGKAAEDLKDTPSANSPAKPGDGDTNLSLVPTSPENDEPSHAQSARLANEAEEHTAAIDLPVMESEHRDTANNGNDGLDRSKLRSAESFQPGLNLLPDTESQLDPEALEALPPDLRAEIAALYQDQPMVSRGQSLLPQSPRRTRPLPAIRRPVTRKRGGRLVSRGNSRTKALNSTLTQAAFVTTTHREQSQERGTETTDEEGADELNNDVSEEFLAALPEDIRREVLEQRRSERLKRGGGIVIQPQRRGAKAKLEFDDVEEDQVIVLPAPRPQPTFTIRKHSSLPDLRQAINTWFQEFEDEGPYREDLEALGRYLTAVVEHESDMQKALSVVQWMDWAIHQSSRVQSDDSPWAKALTSIQAAVNSAINDRGLGHATL